MKLQPAIVLVLLGPASIARADDTGAPPPAPPIAEPAEPPQPPPDPAPDPAAAAMAAKVDELEQRLDDLEDELADARREASKIGHAQDSTRRRIDDLAPASHMLDAYVDVGFFVAAGDGSGVRPDVGHLHFPEYTDRIPADWVLMGDPLSTGINARGEPADLGASRALTDDTIDSEGHPAFIANAIGLRIARDVLPRLTLATHVELLPRGRDTRFAVETARIEYQPSEDRDLVLFAGKIDSVLGLEYRNQDSPRRLGVTPSLLCRYTCGRPVGVSLRYNSYANGRWAGAVALTSGDSFQPGFEPDDRLVASTLPTASARVAATVAAGSGRITLGVSGSIGPQDRQSDDNLVQWHYGVDLSLRDFHDVDVTAEVVQGELPGATEMAPGSTDPGCGKTECLRYKAAYATVAWRATRRLQPYARLDWRDALHAHGADFVYISKVARLTAGVNASLGPRVSARVEYVLNRELGNIPEFPDDVITTSVVVSSD